LHFFLPYQIIFSHDVKVSFRSKTLSSGYTGVTYLSLTVYYSWASPSGAVSQTVQIRDPNGNAVASGGGGGTSGTFTVTATNLNPSTSYSIWGSASSFLGQTYALVQAFGTISYTGTSRPSITSFSANPNPQLSSSGTPTYSTILSWSASDADSYTINGSSVSGNSLNITNLPQSTAGSNSPATRSYQLIASNVAGSDSSTITVGAYNDNNPSLVVISSTVIPGSLNRTNGSLAPLYTYLILCSLNGVDMPTKVRSLTSGVRIGLNTTNFGSSRTVPIGGIFYIEFTSLDYNTSTTVGGTNAQGEIIGQTNTLTFQIEAGTDIVNVDAVTKAPVIQEAFDFSSSVDTYPYPDIDVVPEEPNTDQFTLSNEINLDDVEVDVEVKSSNPDVQVRINGGGWQDIRQI